MKKQKLGLVLMLCLLFWAHLAVSAVSAVPPNAQVTGIKADAWSDQNKVAFSLQELGVKAPIALIGGESQSTVDFSFNRIRVIQRVHLNLHYSYSPLLDPQTSFFKIILNGHDVTTLPLPKDGSRNAQVQIEIDPLILQEWNHLNFQFVGHLNKPFCDNPRATKTWLQISHQHTRIEADSDTLPIAMDMSLFPLQFFDRHDMHDLTMPFVFAKKPSWGALKSAGIIASWLGSQADWRKVNFPSYLNALPKQTAIVLATSGDVIDGVTLPPVKGDLASISIVKHPLNPHAYLLLVVGRDEKSLIEAARALVLAKKLPEGAVWNVQAVKSAGRLPFDAPGWMPEGKTIRLDSVVPAERLQASGLFVRPFEMVMHLPPDLYRSAATVVPFNFAFESSNNARYLARMDAYINNHRFQFERFNKPKDNTAAFVKGQVKLKIPSRLLTGQDTIQVKFTFVDKQLSVCDANFIKDEIRVDPGSTIELSGLPRYVELPNLSYLSYTGYPYSKMADLSETVVLLHDAPDRHEIESMLTVLGHIGNKTGYPATAVSVASIRDTEKFADKDMLVVGSSERLRSLLEDWQSYMQVNLLSDEQPYPGIGSQYLKRWMHWSEQMVIFNLLKGEEGMVLLGFESPLQSGRSVIMLTAHKTSDLAREASLLNTFDKARDFDGDVVVVTNKAGYDGATSFNWAPKYALGKLTLLDWFNDNKTHNPWLAALVAMLVALLFASISYHKFKRKADEKLGRVAT